MNEYPLDTIERLIEFNSYWLIDVLPCRVPENSEGRYFDIEGMFLSEKGRSRLCEQFSGFLLKLYCYYDLKVMEEGQEEWTDSPLPETLLEMVASTVTGDGKPLTIYLPGPDSLITLGKDDAYMTLYAPDDDLLSLCGKLVTSAGLFLWEPEE